MSVEFVDELGVGPEEVSLRHGGDLGVRQYNDDVMAGEPRVIKFRHLFPEFHTTVCALSSV